MSQSPPPDPQKQSLPRLPGEVPVSTQHNAFRSLPHSLRVSIQEPLFSSQATRSVTKNIHSRSTGVSHEDKQFDPTIIRTSRSSASPYSHHVNKPQVSNIFQKHFISTSMTQMADSAQDNVQEPRQSLFSTWSRGKVRPSVIMSDQLEAQSSTSLLQQQDTEETQETGPSHLLNTQNLPSLKTNYSGLKRMGSKKRRHSQLSTSWRMLHGSKRASRWLNLVLCMTAMMSNSLTCLELPWLHFQVPLHRPQDNLEPTTIVISTVFFMSCSDTTCLHEYQNNNLLDFAVYSISLACITSVCLCILLVNILFFSPSNLPVLDFSGFIISLLTAIAMIVGILCYLLQAQTFLQEGMTYSLGVSFYMVWTTVFIFLVIGFISYLNYINVWSVLALQAVWS